MPSNQAAYLTGSGERPFVVKDAPYFSPGAGRVTIKNRAVAINPADYGMQDSGLFIKHWPHVRRRSV